MVDVGVANEQLAGVLEREGLAPLRVRGKGWAPGPFINC